MGCPQDFASCHLLWIRRFRSANVADGREEPELRVKLELLSSPRIDQNEAGVL